MGLQPRKTAHLEEDEPVLPLSTSDDPSSKSRRSKSPAALKIVVGHPIALLALLATLLYFTIPAPTGPVSVFGFEFPFPKPSPAPHPPHVVEGLAKCKVIAKSPPTFNSLQNLKRSHNDRYAPGTQDTLLKNATIWTGNKDGEEVIHGGDVLLVNGLVKKIGKGLQVEQLKREGLVKSHVEEVELDGAWLTPGEQPRSQGRPLEYLWLTILSRYRRHALAPRSRCGPESTRKCRYKLDPRSRPPLAPIPRRL